MKVKLLTAALIISLIGCVLLAYFWIDRSVTLSYVEQSAEDDATSVRELARLLGSEWSGVPENVVLDKLRAEAARHPKEQILVKQEEDAISFDQIQFNFEQGKLKSVGGFGEKP